MIRFPVTVHCRECGAVSEFGERLEMPPNQVKLFLPDGWTAKGVEDAVPTLYCSVGCYAAADARERLKENHIVGTRESINPVAIRDYSSSIGGVLPQPLQYDVPEVEVAAVLRQIVGEPPKE